MKLRLGLGGRLLAACFALAILWSQNGMEPRHACSLHEPLPAADATPTAPHHGHDTDQNEEQGPCCTCLGSSLTVVAAATVTPSTDLPAPVSRRIALARPAADAPHHALPRLLPFATAPPLS